MALTKEYEYDCEVRGPYKAVQVRKSTIIKDCLLYTSDAADD